MTRPLSNPGLDRLFAQRTAELYGDHPGRYCVPDLCIEAECSRQNLYNYVMGIKACPRLEARAAAVFKISVPALRRALGLPARRAT